MRTIYLLFLLVCCKGVTPQWSTDPSNNNAVCNFSGSQTNVQLVADGTGGYIAVWEDTRNSSTDIYAQRINATGTQVWAVDGIPI